MTKFQKETLLKRLQTKPFLEKQEKYQLARSLNISESTVYYWFTKMRGKARKKQLPRNGE